MSHDYCFEDAEFGQPMNVDALRVTVFQNRRGVRVKYERRVTPIVVTKPEKPPENKPEPDSFA